jgi:glutathione S-transferase
MWFSARGTLPVLDLDGDRIVDTTRIIAALEERDREHPLYPDERRRALERIETSWVGRSTSSAAGSASPT